MKTQTMNMEEIIEKYNYYICTKDDTKELTEKDVEMFLKENTTQLFIYNIFGEKIYNFTMKENF